MGSTPTGKRLFALFAVLCLLIVLTVSYGLAALRRNGQARGRRLYDSEQVPLFPLYNGTFMQYTVFRQFPMDYPPNKRHRYFVRFGVWVSDKDTHDLSYSLHVRARPWIQYTDSLFKIAAEASGWRLPEGADQILDRHALLEMLPDDADVGWCDPSEISPQALASLVAFYKGTRSTAFLRDAVVCAELIPLEAKRYNNPARIEMASLQDISVSELVYGVMRPLFVTRGKDYEYVPPGTPFVLPLAVKKGDTWRSCGLAAQFAGETHVTLGADTFHGFKVVQPDDETSYALCPLLGIAVIERPGVRYELEELLIPAKRFHWRRRPEQDKSAIERARTILAEANKCPYTYAHKSGSYWLYKTFGESGMETQRTQCRLEWGLVRECDWEHFARLSQKTPPELRQLSKQLHIETHNIPEDASSRLLASVIVGQKEARNGYQLGRYERWSKAGHWGWLITEDGIRVLQNEDDRKGKFLLPARLAVGQTWQRDTRTFDVLPGGGSYRGLPLQCLLVRCTSIPDVPPHLQLYSPGVGLLSGHLFSQELVRFYIPGTGGVCDLPPTMEQDPFYLTDLDKILEQNAPAAQQQQEKEQN